MLPCATGASLSGLYHLASDFFTFWVQVCSILSMISDTKMSIYIHTYKSYLGLPNLRSSAPEVGDAEGAHTVCTSIAPP